MDKLEGERLVQRYADWLRDYSEVDPYEDTWVVSLPFLDRHRNCLQVYISKTDSGLMLSDYGDTIRDLRICGLVIDTDTRRDALKRILLSSGMNLDGDELQMLTSEDDFPRSLNEMARGMMAIGDLIYMTPLKVARLYEEDAQVESQSEKKPLAAARS